MVSSASESADSRFLAQLRAVGAIPQSETQRFSPKESSDAQLLAIGHEACAYLQGHKPADVLGLLQKTGWSTHDSTVVILAAAQPDALCPGQTKAVEAWIHAATGS
ncbi:hypothetical protein DN069_38490 [Streptacidiphilus pinicola]|uniref:DUF732 domain-containing protein n=2 Tax=Streptacidiphilus pinicola TaxID=2219663 RepID=A0A2X0JZB8_9ACTN|nr:hypothetical protein DN069_38490 [Streptacidiphilus pinicola]